MCLTPGMVLGIQKRIKHCTVMEPMIIGRRVVRPSMGEIRAHTCFSNSMKKAMPSTEGETCIFLWSGYGKKHRAD